jgi:hypothetical protein
MNQEKLAMLYTKPLCRDINIPIHNWLTKKLDLVFIFPAILSSRTYSAGFGSCWLSCSDDKKGLRFVVLLFSAFGG